jgi:septal ring factor EnvC (AmiA/AmiB activator)
MSDISSHITNPPSLHHDEEHEHGRDHAKTPFGMIAACVILAVAAIVLAFSVHERNGLVADLRTQLNQASSDITGLRSDADKANTTATGLKAQLDSAQGQLADFKSQLDQAQSQKSAAQTQLTKVESERSALQRQVDSDKAQLADSQSQLGQANDKVSGLSKELDQAKSQSADMQAQLAKAQGDLTNLQAPAQKAQSMPISTEFKKSFFGSKFTLLVTNLNPDTLNVSITVAGRNAPVTAAIKSGATFDVDGLAAGTNVVIAGNNYASVNLTAQ